MPNCLWASDFSDMQKWIFIIATTLAVTGWGCNSENPLECLGDPGEIVRREVVLEPFSRLKVWQEADIVFRQGDEQKIVLEGPEKLVEQIAFVEDGDWMMMTGMNYCGWVRKTGNPRVEITSPTLRFMWFKDFVNLTTPDTLRFETFYINAHNTGDINLKIDLKTLTIRCTYISTIRVAGKTEKLNLHFIEDGRFLGHDLTAQVVDAKHEGSNDFYVFPVQKLTGGIFSTGDLIVLNEPDTLKVDLQGRGDLILDY